jgi:hypothetical protein
MLPEEKALRKHIRECPETIYKGRGKCCIRAVTALVKAIRADERLRNQCDCDVCRNIRAKK